MKRCHVDQNTWGQKETDLSAEESHHLLDVLRCRPGEPVEVFDGKGRTARAELIAARRHNARLRIQTESVTYIEPPAITLTLLQAVPKQGIMDSIVQKATELGVQIIAPMITERVEIKTIGRAAKQRGQRWEKIALASAKQCRAAWLPVIQPVASLAGALDSDKSDLKIFGALRPATLPFKDVLKKAATVKSIALAIGPEGDFSDKETDLLAQSGFQPVTFGDRVLRVETAAVFGLSVLNYEFRQHQGAIMPGNAL